MKNWSQVPDGRLTPRRTGRLIVGRNVTSNSTSPHHSNGHFTIPAFSRHVTIIIQLGESQKPNAWGYNLATLFLGK
jgi:hypothetical protein